MSLITGFTWTKTRKLWQLECLQERSWQKWLATIGFLTDWRSPSRLPHLLNFWTGVAAPCTWNITFSLIDYNHTPSNLTLARSTSMEHFSGFSSRKKRCNHYALHAYSCCVLLCQSSSVDNWCYNAEILLLSGVLRYKTTSSHCNAVLHILASGDSTYHCQLQKAIPVISAYSVSGVPIISAGRQRL